MDILVPIKFVPDLVEELEIDQGSQMLDRTFLRTVPNELDDHALEEAIILKERQGGTVTVVCVDTGDVDEALFTAIAKGCDRAVKVVGDGLDEGLSSHAHAALIEQAIGESSYDLILSGAQAVDDLDGPVGALLAARKGLPYVGYVSGVSFEGGKVRVKKEYPGGLIAEMDVQTPAVLGIQASEQPPRYVVTSRVMEAMKTATIEEVEAGEMPPTATAEVSDMQLPEVAERAEMIEGGVAEVADALVALLKEHGDLG
jgi:electron transfer flavoprotein beta subunit